MPKTIALILLLLTSLVLAQTEAGKKGLKVRLVAERAPAEIGQVTLAAKEQRSTPFDLPVNFLSAPQVPPQRAFSVWSVAKDVSLATVSLPEQGASFIIILIPAENGGYKPVVIADNNPDFKAGDIFLYNHAKQTALGYVGTSKFSLDPAQSRMLRPAGKSDDGDFYQVGLGYRAESGDRPLSVTRWPIQQGIRTYVFFFVNPRTQRMDYRTIEEFIEPEPPKG